TSSATPNPTPSQKHPAAAADERSAGEQKAIEVVQKLGGKITLDQDAPGKPVVAVDFRNSNVRDSDLPCLKAFPRLQKLDLSDCPLVQGLALRPLKDLKELKELHLPVTGLNEARPGDLAALQGLQTLHLARAPVTDAVLKELTEIKSLQTLDVGGCEMVTDA